MTSQSKTRALVLAGLIMLSPIAMVPFAAGTASAAGATTVSLSPGSATVETGNTTTYDVVVSNADGGVGAYDVSVTAGSDAASIVDVSLGGAPGYKNVTYGTDNSSVRIAAFTADTNDTGAVTIATVTVKGETDGSAALNLSVDSLGDESGTGYDVTAVEDASITVEGQSPPTSLTIVEPDESQEYRLDDTLEVAYKYNETNPESVTVSLLDGETVVASHEVAESQYVDDNATKSLTLDIEEDFGTVADGRYDVRITATDADGAASSVSTDDTPVVLNDNEEQPTVSVDDIAPDTDDFAASGEDPIDANATVNVTYTVGVPDEDAENVSEVTFEIVDADSGMTVATFQNATERTPGTYQATLDLSERTVPDNEDYVVSVTATDDAEFSTIGGSQSASATSSEELDVNTERPTIESVETNAGSDFAHVVFSEPVEDDDGDGVSATDFAYQDVADGGASAIESAVQVAPDTIRVTFDQEVAAEDLGSDIVSVQAGEIVDLADGPGAAVPASDSSVLGDSDAPSVEVYTSPITADNADSYEVTLDTTSEVTDVSMTLTGPNGTEVSDSASSVTGVVPLTFNATELEDGPVAYEVTVTDMGGNNVSESGTIAKDTDRPGIESATVDTGEDTVTVTFDEAMGAVDASDFSMTGTDLVVQDVTESDGEDAYFLILNDSVPYEAINNSNVMLETTAEDLAGSTSEDSATLMDTYAPAIETADLGSNTSTITVTFDEKVVAGDGGALTAANFTYTGDANVTSVDHTAEDSSATLVLTGDVTSEEAGSANVMVADEEVFDRFGNSQSDKITVVDSTDPSDIEIVDPSEQVIKQSDDLLDVTYSYTENVPDNVESVTITLDGPEERSYEIDDTQYTENNKSLSIDLDDGGNLTDGAYDLTIKATDASGNDHSVTENGLVVINDDAPSVSDVTITNDHHDIAPDATLNLTYDYEPAPNATGATVWLVNSEDVSNFAAGDLDNTTYTTYDVSADHGVVDDREVSIDLADEIADNEDYEVFVTATDVSGLTSDAAQAGHNVDVNEYAPAIMQVETNAGSSEVYVHFNESVVAGDGDDELDASDFAYEDVGGTSSITSVERVDDDTVMLVLSDAVSADDLGTDHVSARSGQIVDTDGDNARAVDSSETVTLSDTTDPSVEILSAGSINADNVENYEITLDTTSEVTDVSMTLTGPNGTEVSDNASGVTGEVTLTFNASTLEDGTVAHEVTVTDMGGNNVTVSGELAKDTDRPGIESAQVDTGSSIVAVTFDEAMGAVDASDFSMTGTDLVVQDVTESDGEDAYFLILNDSVPPEAINNSNVTLETTAEDLAGSTSDDSAMLMDTYAPAIETVDAEAGSTTVNVTVDEPLNVTEPSASMFDYVDANGDGDEIVNVTAQSETMFTIELNESLSTADMAGDSVGLNATVTDLFGNEASDSQVPLGEAYPALSASADGSTVTLTLETAANLSADSTSLSIDLEERDSLRSTTGEFDQPFSVELNASDFTETADGVYEATVEVPDDGVYLASGGLATESGNEGLAASADVDTAAPAVADAVLSGISTTDFENDGEPDSTLTVTFTEPVDASQITADDVSIEGHDGDVVAVTPAGAFGYIEVVVEGTVQTGTSPEVSIDSTSYTELAGDDTSGVEDSATVLHTAKLELSEGTNFVSVPAAAGELDLDELDLSNVDVIYSYDAESESWRSFDPDAEENDFSALEGGDGYIFEMDADDTLDVNVFNTPASSGEVSAPSEQELTEGWNLVGHYQEFDQSRSLALSSIGDSVYTVYGQAEGSAALSYEAVAMGDDFEPGEAYWVFVREDEVYAEAPGIQTAN